MTTVSTITGRRPSGRARALAALTAVGTALALAGCGGSSDTTPSSTPTKSSTSKNVAQLALVAYSTPSSAYAKLIAAYQQTPEGKGVSFSTSFGPSGTQSRAVAAGQPADVVNFSLAPDVTAWSRLGSSRRRGMPGRPRGW